jgi:YNFM family putative membrane transporter
MHRFNREATYRGGMDRRLKATDPEFRLVSLGLFATGLATFALLYATQPLMPMLAEELDVSPTLAASTLSVTAGALAVCLLPAGWISERFGRRRTILSGLGTAAAIGLLLAAAPTIDVLIALRILQGVALAGVPAVAMAYLIEEIHPQSLGLAMGLYIGGNAVGGMLGRMGAGVLAEAGGWRVALAGIAAIALVCFLVSALALRPSRQPSSVPPRHRLLTQMTEPGLIRLNAIGALLMCSFVVVYNALGFRLAGPAYALGPAAAAAVFLVYPLGSLSSIAAGRLSDRIGRRRVLPGGIAVAAAGVGLTAAGPLALVVCGMALLTCGFFAGHSVASSWVGRRARPAVAQASAIYLTAYYVGASLAGPLGGAAWSAGAWPGVVLLAVALLAAALVLARQLVAVPLMTRIPDVAAPA